MSQLREHLDAFFEKDTLFEGELSFTFEGNCSMQPAEEDLDYKVAVLK